MCFREISGKSRHKTHLFGWSPSISETEVNPKETFMERHIGKYGKKKNKGHTVRISRLQHCVKSQALWTWLCNRRYIYCVSWRVLIILEWTNQIVKKSLHLQLSQWVTKITWSFWFFYNKATNVFLLGISLTQSLLCYPVKPALFFFFLKKEKRKKKLLSGKEQRTR